MRITADHILGHLVGNLPGDRLYDDEGEEVVAILDCTYGDEGLVVAREPDAYPEIVLGRFRVTVEEVSL